MLGLQPLIATLALFTSATTAAVANIPTNYPFGNTLRQGASLLRGQGLISENGEYTLELQQDSNLVLYSHWGTNSVYPTWATNSQSFTIDHATMQTDGNFVLYDQAEVARWSSQTYRNDNAEYKLVLENNGNLIIYETNAIKYVNYG